MAGSARGLGKLLNATQEEFAASLPVCQHGAVDVERGGRGGFVIGGIMDPSARVGGFIWVLPFRKNFGTRTSARIRPGKGKPGEES